MINLGTEKIENLIIFAFYTIYNFLLRTMRRYANLLAVLALSTNLALHAQTNELVIQTKKLGAEIQPTMYGLFLRTSTTLPTADFMPNW